MRRRRTDLTMLLLTVVAVLGHAFTGCCAHHLHAQAGPTAADPAQSASAPATVQNPLKRFHAVCGCDHGQRPDADGMPQPADGSSEPCQHLPCNLVAELAKSPLASMHLESLQQPPTCPVVSAAQPPSRAAVAVPTSSGFPASAARLRAQLSSWVI